MGKKIDNELIGAGLFSKTRLAVLTFLYSQPASSFYTKQIFDTVQKGRGSVQRELNRLTGAGIIRRKIEGRQVYYQANSAYQAFTELKGLVARIAPTYSPRFAVPPNRLAEFCRRYHINKLSLFGSVLRPDFRPDSDIDVLVEFEPGYAPGFAIVDVENELSRLSKRKIDLRTPKDLSRYFRERVVREAQVQYAAR